MRTDVRQRVSIVRQVFPAWSIHIPPAFDETFLTEPDYWHAWDEDRSVSLSSFVVADDAGPVPAQRLLEQMPPPHGSTLIDALPGGLLGWAAEVDADPMARASRALSGVLAADGRLLAVTVTSDDPEWIRTTWLSIRYHGPPLGGSGSSD
jgi:hypothetical protein